MKFLTRNRYRGMKKIIAVGVILTAVGFIQGCSTTKNLPQGEVLYVGQKKTVFDVEPVGRVGDIALSELEGAINKAPNNSFMGSTRVRTPLPIGLWYYNRYVNSQKKFGKWMFRTFAAKPVFISTLNPDVRTKIGSNILHDFGYFQGDVTSEVIPHKKNERKAYVKYNVHLGEAYSVDTLTYVNFERPIMNMLRNASPWSKIKPDDQFNVLDLDAERQRVSEILRNLGYYYFRPNMLTYEADTTLVAGQVSLRMKPVKGLPKQAQQKFYLGKTTFTIVGKNGEAPNDTLVYKDLNILFHNKLKVRPGMLYRWINADQFAANSFTRRRGKKRLFNQTRHEQMQERLSEVAVFRYIETQYVPRDSTLTNDTLDIRINAALELPMDAQFDFDLTSKSNDQLGPGAAFTLGRRNVFGGGERWDVKLKGSYEWQVGGNNATKSKLLNSYEMGISTSLTFPKLFFPKMHKREFQFPASTMVQIYVNQLNRARYYTMLSFGGKYSYDLQPKRTSRHTITPLRLSFNILRKTTSDFDSIAQINPALFVSLQNQFIPAMEYTYTFDNSSIRRKTNRFWWQSTFTSSGNITSLIYAATGQKLSKEGKNMIGTPFAQFLKFNTDFRYTWNITSKQALVSRVAGGMIYSYGNSRIAPYSEQFYVGGANSIRAFTIRSIGPGGFVPNKNNRYAFIDQTGDIKLEANLEYRFNLIGNLNGALFLDAGNVWLLRDDSDVKTDNPNQQNRANGKISLKDLADQIALGTGFGLRYDLGFLVLRFDWGIGLHLPYETSKKGYYNIEKFKDSFGFHFAVGYPF